MSNCVSGKVAVVTGSSGGMGEGIARALAAEGAAVVISGRRADFCERVTGEPKAGVRRLPSGRMCLAKQIVST